MKTDRLQGILVKTPRAAYAQRSGANYRFKVLRCLHLQKNQHLPTVTYEIRQTSAEDQARDLFIKDLSERFGLRK